MTPVRYTLSKEQHRDFWKMQFDAALARGLLILAGVVAVLAGLALGADEALDAISVTVGGLLGGVIMIALMRFVLVPRQANKAWDEYALIKEEMTLSLGPEGFSIAQESGHVDGQWSDMRAWNETDTIFAIYVTRQLAYLLPKDQVPASHLDYARQNLIESGLAKAGKQRK